MLFVQHYNDHAYQYQFDQQSLQHYNHTISFSHFRSLVEILKIFTKNKT